MSLRPNPGILSIDPYVPGKSKAKGDKVIKLSSNENPLGPSPMAMEAYKQAAENIHRYPDGASVELRLALAEKYNIDRDRIICGTGSDEIITLLCKAYCSEGDEVLYSQYGFLMYPIAALAAGATPIKAMESERRTDLNALLADVTPRTKIIFLANPNNPTGALVSKTELENFHAKLPKDVLLVIDAAYAEYVEASDYSDGLDMAEKFGNVVALRTFSKIYGLGGLRVGWSYSSQEIADVLNRIRGVFNINLAAQAAAIAALKDQDYFEKSLKINSDQKKWISDKLSGLGLTVYPSEGNFILFSLGSKEKAEACLEFLIGRGIILRGMGAYDLADCLRLTIGLPEDMKAVYTAIGDFISADAG